MEETTSTETAAPEATESTETVTETATEENSYNADYKDDYSVNSQGTEEENQYTEPEVDYSEDEINSAMMEYLKDNYEIPEKFNDIGALINSYKHLEGKIGNLKGAPENYEIDAEVFDHYSDSVLNGVAATARDLGLDNEGLNKLLSVAQQNTVQEQEANWAIEKQKMGQNAEREIADAVQLLNANFTPEVSETIQGMIQTADQFYAMKELLGNSKSSAPAQNTNVVNQPSESDVQKMLYAKDDYGNLKMESDSAYAAKVNRMMQDLWV